MQPSHVQVAGIEAPVLLSRYGDVEGFCRDTEGLVSRLAFFKVAAALAGSICILESGAGLAGQNFEAATLWAIAGIGAVGLARLLWERLATSDMVAVQPLASALASEAFHGRVELFWRNEPRHSAVRMGRAGAEILLNVQGSLAFRPDLLARWAGHWGYFTRRVPTLVVHARPFAALENGPAAEGLHLDAAGTLSRLPAPGLSARRSAAYEPLQIQGTIFGENRGKRTLGQLARKGELSQWLRLSRESARAHANEAWGENPGIPRDRKLRIAYLCAVDSLSARGLDCTVLTVTRMMRKAIHDAGFATPGLSGGEKGGWIADLLKGQLQAFEQELRAAANRLEHRRKS